MRRLFTLAVGIALGASVAIRLLRRFDQARDALAPSALTERWVSSTSELRDRLAHVRAQIRQDAAAHEAALRAEFDVPPLTADPHEDATWIR